MTTVIYHSADFDGIFCREIAKRFYKDKANYIGWNYGDPIPLVAQDEELVILDLSIDELMHHPHLLWIDHHKTAIEKYSSSIRGFRIDGVAACRLAYQWFLGQRPEKSAFIERTVVEPYAIRLAGEYDIWDKRDPNADTFQFSLRVADIEWDRLFLLITPYTHELLEKGKIAQTYAQKTDASICSSKSWLMEWEGLKFLCINTARFNSLFFTARDYIETGHDALLGFNYNGNCWTISLYHAKHNTNIDLSTIAVKYGGGGHRGACGFTCKQLPFSL